MCSGAAASIIAGICSGFWVLGEHSAICSILELLIAPTPQAGGCRLKAEVVCFDSTLQQQGCTPAACSMQLKVGNGSRSCCAVLQRRILACLLTCSKGIGVHAGSVFSCHTA